MVARGHQNGRQGLERGVTLGYKPFRATFTKQVSWSEHSLYFDQSEASKSKMAARGPQNGRRGLERGPTLGYWALPSTFAKYVFWSKHSFYEKRSRRRRKMKTFLQKWAKNQPKWDIRVIFEVWKGRIRSFLRSEVWPRDQILAQKNPAHKNLNPAKIELIPAQLGKFLGSKVGNSTHSTNSTQCKQCNRSPP